MSFDIAALLTKLSAIEEGAVTPVAVKKGLNPQQKEVPQLSALVKPKKISALGAKTDPKHPLSGYMVGASESEEHEKTALEEAMCEIEEDMLSKVKKDLTTYLDKLEQKVKKDRDLIDKVKDEIADENPAKPGTQEEAEEECDEGDISQLEKDIADAPVKPIANMEEDPTPAEPPVEPATPPQIDPTLAEMGAPVKYFTMEDGSCIECHGDTVKGFELRRNGRSMPSRFPSLDHAQMAVDLYKARQKKNDLSQDYIEER